MRRILKIFNLSEICQSVDMEPTVSCPTYFISKFHKVVLKGALYLQISFAMSYAYKHIFSVFPTLCSMALQGHPKGGHWPPQISKWPPLAKPRVAICPPFDFVVHLSDFRLITRTKEDFTKFFNQCIVCTSNTSSDKNGQLNLTYTYRTNKLS